MQKARINAEVTVCTKDEVLKSDGELQLTDYGVSGIVIFQISGCVAKRLLKGEDVYLNIDFMPDYGEEKLNTILNKLMQDYYDKDISKVLVQGLSCLLNDNIAKAIIMDMELSGVFKQVNNPFDDKNTNSVLIRELVDRIKGFRLKVIGTKSFDSAQVCSGGVSFKEVTEQMESKLINNLYITGELLDVDGICGGYNLHFAFISGMIAGTSV
jgi:predicted Rossmann fold flavoprotein